MGVSAQVRGMSVEQTIINLTLLLTLTLMLTLTADVNG
jgi:hypothetical protein